MVELLLVRGSSLKLARRGLWEFSTINMTLGKFLAWILNPQSPRIDTSLLSRAQEQI